MHPPRLVAAAVFACAFSLQAVAENVYRWVDEEGVVHYGDSVPPEYAEADKEVFNERGIQVGTIEGALTAEERIEVERLEAERAREAEQARMDRVLLDTYTSVEEIELLRDRRIELLDARARVTEQYLENLRARLARLEAQSQRFRGADGEESGTALPEKLAEDMLQTMTLIDRYEQTLARARQESSELYQQFESQIARYRELRGLDEVDGEPQAKLDQ